MNGELTLKDTKNDQLNLVRWYKPERHVIAMLVVTSLLNHNDLFPLYCLCHPQDINVHQEDLPCLMCAAAAKGDNETLLTLMQKVCMHTSDTASKSGQEN